MVMCQQATISDLPSYDTFVPQKPPFWKNFDDVILCDLWFRPPHSKILGSLINRRSPEKIFKDLFFRRTLAAVSLVLDLGLEHSCPWPREVLSSKRLSLALALASDFFCVLGLGLEPCVLDSTSAKDTCRQGMVWNGKWNENLGMEYGKMQEWNGRFQEWKRRQFSILSYQFHTKS